MSKPYEEIAPRLRALRDAVDMSVQDMAQKTGMSVEEIENYESGLHEIPVSFLFDVAKVCGVDTTVLISGGDSHLKGFTVVRGEGGLDVRRRKDYGYKSLAYRFARTQDGTLYRHRSPKESEEMNFNHHSARSSSTCCAENWKSAWRTRSRCSNLRTASISTPIFPMPCAVWTARKQSFWT